ncbi:6-phospho-3-hexuloisomerase [Hyperthermus butylicus]|uniref:Sugar phosphate isomerase n=1 Tax=Hyperthermus butylicus (strain DSM 5456 / JCM 9403 / PLM1-5) TaxID=415426 RepID=A2BM61_HYPBU|nr:6-phospho-3-hexuloisomerase [Hyperthermus butylicus]ABM81072.1 putative sugar phosphate isomerase [Hyperthermus butylicus DSM 5456]
MIEYVRKTMKEIVMFIDKVIEKLNEEQVSLMLDVLENAYRQGSKILVMGAGRSGLVGRAFAMRLMHLGFNVYVLGETITPSIGERDVVVAISGSGRTQLIVTAAEAAKKVKATIIAITSYPDSPLGRLADIVVEIPGRTKLAPDIDYFARQILGIHEPLAPLGTLFEDTALVFLDGVVVELMHRLGKSEVDLRARHANIEL